MKKKSSERKPRLPQRSRVEKQDLPQSRMTARDRGIVHAVYEYRALTTQQIFDLLFVPPGVQRLPSPSSRCLHRLKLLYHHGFLRREELPHMLAEGRKPFVYRLDKRGAELLALLDQSGVDELDWSPDEHLGHLFLDHLIRTNDVRIAIVRAAQRHTVTIETWLDERTLSRFQKDTVMLTGPTGRKQSAAVVPDGYVHLYTGKHHYHQFLEVDRATVTGSSKSWTTRTWARKVATYIEYYRSGKYQDRYHTKSMRILTVTTGEKRLANLREITERSGGKARFWFTTFERIHHADVLADPIWDVAFGRGTRSLTWDEE